MKNICLINTAEFWGGGEKLFLDYTLRLRDKGFKVSIIAKKGSPLYIKAQKSNLNLRSVSTNKWSPLNPILFFKLLQFFKKHKIDSVFLIRPGDIKSFGFAAKYADVKNIVYLRGLARKIKGSSLNKLIFTKVLTHIIANSEETKRMILLDQAAYLSRDKVKVIYHGIDFSKINYVSPSEKSRINQSSTTFQIACACRLDHGKGLEYIVPLALVLKSRGLEFKISIAGTGPVEKQLSNEVTAHGLEDRIELVGFISDMHSFYKDADMFLMLSVSEGFGFVTVEAMAASKPVIAFEISSHPEIIADGKAGFLVPFADIESMADRIIQLANNQELCIQMGQFAYNHAREKFNVADKIDEIIKHILVTSF